MELAEQLMDTLGKKENAQRLFFAGTQNERSSALIEFLAARGFQIKEAPKFSAAIDVLYSFMPDVIILDSCNDELSALELCTMIKSKNSLKKSIVIILSDRKDELMEMTAFNSGADDFIILPINMTALLGRIKVRMKKTDKVITVIQNYADALPVTIDLEAYSVSLGDRFLQLSKKEFELLYVMASNPEKLFRREELYRLVWNKKTMDKNRTIDVHISRLRQKLGKKFISSQKGVGYRFMV